MTDHAHDFDYCCRACGSVVYGGDNYCVVCGALMTEENTVVYVPRHEKRWSYLKLVLLELTADDPLSRVYRVLRDYGRV